MQMEAYTKVDIKENAIQEITFATILAPLTTVGKCYQLFWQPNLMPLNFSVSFFLELGARPHPHLNRDGVIGINVLSGTC
jgi:hypothetical protein